MIRRVVFLFFVGLLSCSSLLGQDHHGFIVKADLFGLSASIPSSQYRSLSPEIEWRPKQSKYWSFSLDFEHYASKRPYLDAALTASSGELYYGNTIRKENTLRLGVRRYFGNRPSAHSGLYLEIQGGLSKETNDSIYSVVVQPSFYSEQINPELRLRSGYQYSFTEHIVMDASLGVDFRRLVTKEDWFRCFIPELNFGVMI